LSPMPINKNLSIIVAMGDNKEVGYKDDLPWGKMPIEDKEHFYKAITGSDIVVGRRTFNSIPSSVLNRSRNILVLTRDKSVLLKAGVIKPIHTITNVNYVAKSARPLLIIGGGEIYNLLYEYVSELYVTFIKGAYKADTFFSSYMREDWLISSTKYKNIFHHNRLPL